MTVKHFAFFLIPWGVLSLFRLFFVPGYLWGTVSPHAHAFSNILFFDLSLPSHNPGLCGGLGSFRWFYVM